MRQSSTWAGWVTLGAAVGLVAGTASALFLALLDAATATRVRFDGLVYALPVAGFLLGLLYERLGAKIASASDLVVSGVWEPGPRMPLRMAPMVLVGTVLTHLFGGSAGREGTAVQMGASLADNLFFGLRLPSSLRRPMLVAGVAGGFGSVFGTPVAGAVFALEFLVLGRIESRLLVPAIVASVVGDYATAAWGVGHVRYPSPPAVPLTPGLLLIWLVFAVAVAGATIAFIEVTGWVKRQGQRHLRRLPLRMAAGGLVVVLLWQALGTSAYLGLGVPQIVAAFETHPEPYAFALKILFTALTVGSGFLGGEVTPLFFVGATLGSALSEPLGVPVALGAAVGLAAVFGTAANAPLALSIMAVELLGASVMPHVVVVGAISYLLCGHRGIYPAQRLTHTKDGEPVGAEVSLRDR